MRRFDKINIITEANQRLEREFLNSKVLVKENKEPSLNKVEIDIISKILEGDVLGEGEKILNEGSFSDIRKKFNSALKKGAMTLGVLAAILGSPNMAQAQKAQLKKDVTDSTWFLDQETNIKNSRNAFDNFNGEWYQNPNFDQDLEDYKDTDGADKWSSDFSVEKWVNNLGQDSTVYKQWQQKTTTNSDGNQVFHKQYTKGDPVKTVVNKDVKPWKTADFSLFTKKGRIGDYLWSKDKTKSITPKVHKELKKLEKGKKVNTKDRSSRQAKEYQDGGFSSSDFYTVDLQNIQSPS